MNPESCKSNDMEEHKANLIEKKEEFNDMEEHHVDMVRKEKGESNDMEKHANSGTKKKRKKSNRKGNQANVVVKKKKEWNIINWEVSYLPREVLVNIFAFYVKSEGVAKLLTIVSNVSLEWKDASTDSRLWATVNDPNLSRVTLLRLKKQLSFTRHLNVSHLRKSLMPGDMLKVIPFCPKLKSINFQTKDSVKTHALLKKLPDCCPDLQKVTFSPCHVTTSNVSPLLRVCGPNLTYLDFSEDFFPQFSPLMREIAKSCPLLEELHLQRISGANMVFPYEIFQTHCLKLRVLELDEVQFSNSTKNGPGFPELEIFACRVIFESGPDDNVLTNILHSSTKLKTLILSGNTGVSCISLSRLNCSLEILNLSRSKIANLSLHLVIINWKHSLKCLDLSGLGNEHVLNETIKQLISKDSNSPLIELNLSASPILLDVLQQVLLQCPELTYLNIESCRNLPRGTKRVYHTYNDIQALRQKLK